MRRRKAPAVRARGLTIIEAVVALIIIATLVPPTLIIITDAHAQRGAPILASRARWLVTEKLEDIIADRHSSSRGYSYVQDASYPDEDPVSGFTGFSRSTSITETGDDLVTAGTGCKRIIVTVSWIDPRAGAQTLSLQTVVTSFDP